MQAPDTMCVGRANGTCEQEVEGGQVGGQLGSLRGGEEIVGRETGGVKRAVIGCEATQRLGVLWGSAGLRSVVFVWRFLRLPWYHVQRNR